ncbi:MAG: hypothetical protein M9908_04930 [Phyllobacteriaceae bacterium]|nr:hypothetical protein [Phyllobacteriaceae bacterium]
MLAVVYVIVTGFVAAGLLNALHQAIQLPQQANDGSPALLLSFETPLDKAWSLIMCTFAGPYYLVRYGLRFWLQSILPGPAFALCLALGAVWSFFSGVVLVETALLVGAISQ